MSNKLDTVQLEYIKKHTELGQKSPEIAKALNISVWVVRKYRRRIKKGSVCHQNKDDLLREHLRAILTKYVIKYTICGIITRVGVLSQS